MLPIFCLQLIKRQCQQRSLPRRIMAAQWLFLATIVITGAPATTQMENCFGFANGRAGTISIVKLPSLH